MSSEHIILTVDDSPTIRREIKMLLEKSGFVVREAGSEIGMTNKLDEYGKPVDLVIMDLNLKNEDGFNLIEIIRANEKYKNIPVIILTQYADSARVMLAKLIGVEGYVKKPIEPEELLKKVNKILGAKK